MTSVPPPPPLPGKTGIKFRGHFPERQKSFLCVKQIPIQGRRKDFSIFCMSNPRAPGEENEEGGVFLLLVSWAKNSSLEGEEGREWRNGRPPPSCSPFLSSSSSFSLSLSLHHPSLLAPASHPKTEQPAMSPHDCQKGKREESGEVGDGSFAPCTRGHEK